MPDGIREWLELVDWRGGDWITPMIHVYALVVFALIVAVWVHHRSRLRQLASRIGRIAAQVEGRATPVKVQWHTLTGLILYLSEVVVRRPDSEIRPIVSFLKREEEEHATGGWGSLVNVTETMIELLPMMGILGTVWAISGVGAIDFGSERLLALFGVATGSTLFALMYLVIFRIGYAAVVQGVVTDLEANRQRYQAFLSSLEQRTRLLPGEPSQPAPQAGAQPRPESS